jgi:hypothetical protein
LQQDRQLRWEASRDDIWPGPIDLVAMKVRLTVAVRTARSEMMVKEASQ